MREFWILLFASNFIADSWTLDINHLDVTYGQQLSILMTSMTENLMFAVNKPQQDYIWSSDTQPKKGQVIEKDGTKKAEERHFIIDFVTFVDQGNYTECNKKNEVLAVHVVTVHSKRRTKGCMPETNLSISLDGLSKNEVKLHFFSSDGLNLTLVERGLPVTNQQPGYWERIHVATKYIHVLIADASDVGKYILSDRQNNTVMIVTLNMDGCELKTTKINIMHGKEFNIKLPIWFKKLEFKPGNEVQPVTWPSCTQHPRKSIEGSGSKREFMISPVTFNDQGTYTRWNYRNQVSSVYELEVVYAKEVPNCVAGDPLKITLDGLSKDEVKLHFSNQNLNIILVENGAPVGNSHEHFTDRIRLTNSDIQVLKMEEYDIGNYTLIDREDRKVKFITPKIISKSSPLLALLLLALIPACICCCFGDKICKKCSKPKAGTDNIATPATSNNAPDTAPNIAVMTLENRRPLLECSPDQGNSDAPAGKKMVKKSPKPKPNPQ